MTRPTAPRGAVGLFCFEHAIFATTIGEPLASFLMSGSKKAHFRFSLKGLLIIMAAVAMVTAFVAKASPTVQKLASAGDFGFILAATLLATLIIMPLAFVLVVRLGMFGLKGRKPPTENKISRSSDRRPD